MEAKVPASAAIGPRTTRTKPGCSILRFSISDEFITEFNSGLIDATFEVTLDRPAEEIVTVAYQTTNGTAKAGDDDFISETGTVTFQPGDIAEEVAIGIVGDTMDEDDEVFGVQLSSPTGAALLDAAGQGTIVDDDAPPAVSVADAAPIKEGNRSSFVASLAGPSRKTVTVSYATVDGSAKQPKHYAERTGTVTFPAGKTTATVRVPTKDDGKDEKAEKFYLNLSNPAEASIGDEQAEATIKDND